MKFIKDLFAIEKRPTKGLFALEWVAMASLLLTLLVVMYTST